MGNRGLLTLQQMEIKEAGGGVCNVYNVYNNVDKNKQQGPQRLIVQSLSVHEDA